MKKLLLFLSFLIALPAMAQQQVQLTQTKSVTVIMQNAATANGNGNVLPVDGETAAMVTMNCSSCSGGTTLNFEIQNDGSNFSAIYGLQLGTNFSATSTQAAGLTYWRFSVAGGKQLRVRISGYSAGTITVTGTTVPAILSNDAPNTDPCDGVLPTLIAGSLTADTQVISTPGAGIKRHYCMIALNNASATDEKVSVVESTTGGGTCTTSPSVVVGSASADSSGWRVAASGGGVVFSKTMPGPLTNAATCIKVDTGALQIDYVITYVQQ